MTARAGPSRRGARRGIRTLKGAIQLSGPTWHANISAVWRARGWSGIVQTKPGKERV